MLEHLHPNIEGCFTMADAFYETMRSHRFITDTWNSSQLNTGVNYRKSWGYTPLDSVYADLRVRILKGGWPFQPKSATNTALLSFRQKTKVDSVALKVWQQKSYTLERAHFDLAVYYESQNDLRRAFNEYNALVCLTPYNVSPYIKAAEVLIKAGRLNQAFPILHQSLLLENTAYAQKWIGQILLNRNNINEALPFLERAYKMGQKDPQLLYNLSGAYAMSSQFDKARIRLDELYQINPNFPDAEYLRQQLDRIRAQNK
jgi:tetratricopeptide (TPR) repeat protein